VGEGLQALAGEPLGSDDEPSGDGGGRWQLVVAVDEQGFDGFLAEDAAELGVQVTGGAVRSG
jgi:hypothetical protein